MGETLEHTNTEQSTSWWVWCSWIEKDADTQFLYGCAARAFRAVGWTGNDLQFEVPGGGQLFICQRTISAEVLEAFRGILDQSSVKLATLIGRPAPEANVLASRRVIQSALGHTAARSDCYYTLPDFDSLLSGADGAWQMVLSTLQKHLNLPFEAAYAGRVGNFEIFDLNSWLDRPQPFQIEAIPDGVDPVNLGPRTLRISRDRGFAQRRHMAHVVGRANGDVLIDRLVTLEVGQERAAPLECAEPLVDFDFRLFDGTGKHLLHFEHRVFLRGVNLTLAPVSREYVIDDKLTSRAAGKNPALGRTASNVVGYNSVRSNVPFGKDGPWLLYSDKMTELAASLVNKPSEDKWFPPGIDSEVAVIQHFNLLLHGGQIQHGILVDAWFGEDALRRFALRIGSRDVKLTIVTSWTTKDPDTGEQLDPAKRPTEKLARALTELSQLINPRLTVLNLEDGGKRSFHDRYFVLYPHDGPAKVYLLSNSINKMAGNWPFCMSPLKPDVARQAQAYIEGLCLGEDVTGATSPTITFQWPSNGD